MVPSPAAEAIETSPSCSTAMACRIVNPSPVPWIASRDAVADRKDRVESRPCCSWSRATAASRCWRVVTSATSATSVTSVTSVTWAASRSVTSSAVQR